MVVIEPRFGVQGRQISGNKRIIGGGIKIAVWAFGLAEGDVDVEAGARGQGPGVRDR